MSFLYKVNLKYEVNASSTLYHYTQNRNARTILYKDLFELSKPERPEDKGYYYLSTSRSKFSGYHVNAKTGTIFVLDGSALNKKYKRKPINFYHFNPGERKHIEVHQEDEMEERVLSLEPEIKNAHKYIKEIHILKSPHAKDEDIIKGIKSLAEKKHIPCYLYKHYNMLSWLNLNTRNAIKPWE